MGREMLLNEVGALEVTKKVKLLHTFFATAFTAKITSRA